MGHTGHVQFVCMGNTIITIMTYQKPCPLLDEVFEFHIFTRIKDNATANVL